MNDPLEPESLRATPFSDLANVRREIELLNRVIRLLLIGLTIATFVESKGYREDNRWVVHTLGTTRPPRRRSRTTITHCAAVIDVRRSRGLDAAPVAHSRNQVYRCNMR